MATLRVNFGEDGGRGCSAFLLEVPEQEVDPGEEIELRIWGAPREALGQYLIKWGSQGLGAGKTVIAETEDVVEEIDYAEQAGRKQLKWPIRGIVSVVAASDVMVLDGVDVRAWKQRGDDCTALFRRVGGSCVELTEKRPVFGNFTVRAARVEHYKRWMWQPPAGLHGVQWFFVYKAGFLFRKFSLTLPEAEAGEVGGSRTVVIRVVEFSSEAPVAGATVTVGDTGGTTDESGEVQVTLDGGTHSLKIVKSGFVDSDVDEISNDEIEV